MRVCPTIKSLLGIPFRTLHTHSVLLKSIHHNSLRIMRDTVILMYKHYIYVRYTNSEDNSHHPINETTSFAVIVLIINIFHLHKFEHFSYFFHHLSFQSIFLIKIIIFLSTFSYFHPSTIRTSKIN